MKYALNRLTIAMAILLIVLVWTAHAVNTYAATGGLSLSPPLQEVTLGPGLLQANIDVTLKNTTGIPVNASYKLIDLKALGTYGGSTLDQAGLPDKYNLANWMTLSAGDTQTISGEETVTIKIAIDNRSDLAPGGHYGALVITTRSGDSTKSSVSLNQQIVSFIFVKKLGGEKYGLDLESLTPNSLSSIPDTVALHFKNTGNVHVMPRGYIEVINPSGTLVSKGIINPESTFVIPETSRKFVTTMQSVSNDRPGGRYTVTVHYRYDGQEEFLSKSIFIDQPLVSTSMVLIFAGGFTFILLGIYLAWRRRHR